MRWSSFGLAVRTAATGLVLLLAQIGTSCKSRQVTQVAGYSGAGTSAKDEVVSEEASRAVGLVRTEVVTERLERWDELEAPATVELDPSRVSHVLLPVPGRIREVLVRLGDSVAAGQALLVVESPEAMSAFAAYRQASAELRRARAAWTKASRDLARLKDLFEHRAASQRDLWAAENELAQSQAALEQAEAEEQASRRRLELLGLKPDGDPGRVVVRAPITGKVVEIAVAPGEYRTDTSSSLMQIADLSVVWISSNVPENQIRLIQVGEKVDVELTAYPGEIIRGTVRRIADRVDPDTRTVKVHTEVSNPLGKYRPGMFGRIRHWHGVRAAAAIPATAVVHEREGDYVFVERKRGHFEKRRIRAGQKRGEWLPVMEGLRPGERVVVEGAPLLKGH